MNFASILKFRVPSDLQARLDETAIRSARTRSDVTREALVIGLEHLTSRLTDDTTKAA